MAKKQEGAKVNALLERDKFVLVDAGKLQDFEYKYTKEKTKQATLDKILTGDYDCVHYEGLNAAALETCIKQGWADPEETQNSSPSIAEILEFIKANPSFVVHGYLITAKRDDKRISVEGVIAVKEPTPQEYKNYVGMFHQADEFDNEMPYRAWYD
jgi:hypothetical protein